MQGHCVVLAEWLIAQPPYIPPAYNLFQNLHVFTGGTQLGQSLGTYGHSQVFFLGIGRRGCIFVTSL